MQYLYRFLIAISAIPVKILVKNSISSIIIETANNTIVMQCNFKLTKFFD